MVYANYVGRELTIYFEHHECVERYIYRGNIMTSHTIRPVELRLSPMADRSVVEDGIITLPVEYFRKHLDGRIIDGEKLKLHSVDELSEGELERFKSLKEMIDHESR